MAVVVQSPTRARVEGRDAKEVGLHLEYKDLRAAYALRRFKNNPYNHRLEPEEYAARVNELTAAVKCSLLERGPEGQLLVPAGLAGYLAEKFDDVVRDEVDRPEGRCWTWAHEPDKVLRPYQRETVDELIRVRHGGAALSPGTGKTLVALHYVKDLGLPAVVFSPSSSIVLQTHREFVAALGKRRVGMYGNGKHDTKQDVLVCTSQALARIKPGTAVWDAFAKRRAIVGDEAHTLAADTMSQICLQLLAEAPFRAFLSGTMARYDGLDLLLRGIVGPIVREMSLREAVAGGYLTRPAFRMLEVENQYLNGLTDPMRATQEALYRSDRANAAVAAMANRMVAAGRPVLILVDELDQYARLLPLLRHSARFAHGCTDKKVLAAKVPPSEHASDVLDLADRFNAGEFPILVGTSCLGIGVDIRAAGAAFWFRGGRSINDIEQGVGRAVRLHPGKTDVVWFDLDVTNGGIVSTHAEARERIYKKLYPDFRRIKI